MALPDNPYIVTSDVDTYFVNKDTGLPLANGLLYFYKDSARTVKKNVYQISGNYPSYTFDTPFPNPIVLSSVGTVQNASGDNLVIYYKPYDADGNIEKYYVVCTDQNGVEQFTRSDWPNIEVSGSPTPPDSEKIDYTNQISNPTFTNVFLNEGLVTTYTVSADTNKEFLCAPNWTFVISGTGTVKVKRVAISGNDHVVSNPAYVLDIEISSGITACYLRQRFTKNSGLWSSTNSNNIFLNGSFLAKSLTGSTTSVKMYYSESTGNTNQLIVDGSVTSAYEISSGTSGAIPLSLNTNPNGYVDIFLSFLDSTHVAISSIQLVPTTTNTLTDFPITFDSSNRNEAYQGDYYIPRLNSKRINSYLVGWDFPLNPAQFGSSGNVTTTAEYILDQTISVCTAGTVAWSKNATTNNLKFVTSNTNNAFCVIQYLDGNNVKEMLNDSISLNICASQSVGTAAVCRAYLFTGNNGSTIPTLPSIIGTLNSDGTFTGLVANWSVIPRGNISDVATFSLTSSTQDFGFTGWQIADATAQYFAIVLTFQYVDSGTTIDINSISLVPGDIPSRPSIQSPDKVLQQCQYYYEKSYDDGFIAGSGTGFTEIVRSQGANPGSGVSTTHRFFTRDFAVEFNTIKRKKPTTISFYSPLTGTIDTFDFYSYVNGVPIAAPIALTPFSTYWGFLTLGQKGFSVYSKYTTDVATSTGPGSDLVYSVVSFHYIADSRLGKV